MKWNSDQLACIEAALAGESFMLMGVPGTGKSTVIHYVVEQLREQGKVIGITATTGVAADIVSGDIINSFLGLGIVNADEPYSKFLSRIKNNVSAIGNWIAIHVLILDEASMMGAEVLDMMDYAARDIRKDARPFGGIQVIMSGDFFQNGPIRSTSKGEKLKPIFAFESRVYRRVFVKHIELKTIYRQKDELFQQVLGEVRNAQLSEASIAILNSRINAKVDFQGIEPTVLYPMNVDVHAFNARRLKQLNKPIYIFRSVDFLHDKRYAKKLETCRYPSTLELAVGAQVMLLSNNAVSGLINGSRGVVEGFSRLWNPLAPASYNINDAFKVKVRFKTGSFEITPSKMEFHNINGNLVATRYQFPLMLAWASSIHKAQGSQMDCVVINPEKIFAPGMFYVALSRVTSLDGLCLENFNKLQIRTYPIVLQWYKNNFEGTITKKYLNYTKRLTEEPFQAFAEDTAMDFFLLFVLKYAPLKEIRNYPPSIGRLACEYLNTFKTTEIFECLL